jgi:glycerophosphoryl diester phosphodiesterase
MTAIRSALMVLLSILPTVLSAQTIITGHRGAAGLAPENTLISVQKALALGVHRVEVDVQQTKDGVVICLHDKTLDRTTDMHGQVRESTWAQLQQAKANVGFEKTFPDAGIPTLEEVLKEVNGKAEFVIEIKDGDSYYPGIEDKVAALIKKYKAEKWALVHTFNDEALFHLHEHHPTIRLQKLFVAKTPWLPIMLDFNLHISSLSDYPFVEAFSVHHSFITQSIIDKAHAMRKKIHVWTVNESEEMEELVEMGVDGIITDRPDLLMKKVGR